MDYAFLDVNWSVLHISNDRSILLHLHTTLDRIKLLHVHLLLCGKYCVWNGYLLHDCHAY